MADAIWHTPGRLLWMAQCDINEVRKHAAYILTIRGRRVTKTTGSGRLGIIAVLGPALIGGRNVKDALLLEIGLGATRPYRQSSKGGILRPRHRLAHLTEEQYRLIAPKLFLLLQEWVDEGVAEWICNPDNPFKVKFTRTHFSSRQGFNEWEKSLFCVNGKRFAVHEADSMLLADLYWHFLRQEGTHHQLRGMARQFDKALRLRKGTDRIRHEIVECLRAKTTVRSRIRYVDGVKEVESTTRQMPGWLLTQLPAYMPSNRPSYGPCMKEIVYQVTGWNGNLPPQITLARSVLKGAEHRVPNFALRAISDLRSGETLTGRLRDQRTVVFELLPSDGWRKVIEIGSKYIDEVPLYDDDVPF